VAGLPPPRHFNGNCNSNCNSNCNGNCNGNRLNTDQSDFADYTDKINSAFHLIRVGSVISVVSVFWRLRMPPRSS